MCTVSSKNLFQGCMIDLIGISGTSSMWAILEISVFIPGEKMCCRFGETLACSYLLPVMPSIQRVHSFWFFTFQMAPKSVQALSGSHWFGDFNLNNKINLQEASTYLKSGTVLTAEYNSRGLKCLAGQVHTFHWTWVKSMQCISFTKDTGHFLGGVCTGENFPS